VFVGGVQWGIILVGLFVGCRCWCNGPHYFICNWL